MSELPSSWPCDDTVHRHRGKGCRSTAKYGFPSSWGAKCLNWVLLIRKESERCVYFLERKQKGCQKGAVSAGLDFESKRLRRWAFGHRRVRLSDSKLYSGKQIFFECSRAYEVFTTQLKRTTWSRTAYLGPHSLNHSELVAWITSVALPMVTLWMLTITAYRT